MGRYKHVEQELYTVTNDLADAIVKRHTAVTREGPAQERDIQDLRKQVAVIASAVFMLVQDKEKARG